MEQQLEHWWCILWCMQRTNIYLEERQTAALDRLAADERVSRAEVIRRILDRALAGAPEPVGDDLAVIDRSFGVLVDVELPQRGRSERDAWLEEQWQS